MSIQISLWFCCCTHGVSFGNDVFSRPRLCVSEPEFVLPYSFAHTSAVSMWKSTTQKAQLQLFMAVRSNLIVEVYLVLRFFSVGKSEYKFQFSNIPLLVLVRNGWEWGNGIIIHSYCGSFPHSLQVLSTSKFLSKDSKIGPSDHRQPFATSYQRSWRLSAKGMRDQTDTKSAAVLRCSMESTGSPKKSSNQAANQPLFMEKLSKSSGSQPASVLPSRSCTKSILYQVVIVCLCIYIYKLYIYISRLYPLVRLRLSSKTSDAAMFRRPQAARFGGPGSEAAEPWHGAMHPIGQVILRHLRPHELMQAMAIFWAPRGRSKSTYGRCWSLNRGGIVFVSFGAWGPIHQLS